MVLDCYGFAEPSVRSELMEQVPHIAVYCQENKVLFGDAMPAYILPMVVRYLNDANNQVSPTPKPLAATLTMISTAETPAILSCDKISTIGRENIWN